MLDGMGDTVMVGLGVCVHVAGNGRRSNGVLIGGGIGVLVFVGVIVAVGVGLYTTTSSSSVGVTSKRGGGCDVPHPTPPIAMMRMPIQRIGRIN